MDENGNKKIFIIDDDTFLLNMYVSKFEKAGFAVETAKGAGETIKKLQDGYKPSAVLLDMVLPGTDGVELLKQIKKEKLAEGATFILFTNNQDGGDGLEEARALGVKDYIIKAELVPSAVVEKVVEIVGRKN